METVEIEPYIKLYADSLKLEDIKPLHNQTYQVFKRSKTDIRIAHRSQLYDEPTSFEKIKHFTLNNEYFYMIPLTTIKGTITGFIVRGVLNSDYNTVTRTFPEYDKQVPFMFGFDQNFLKYSELRKCYPIIVCEGCKDCMTMKKFYPFVLSNNTNQMGLNVQILRNLSNRFLLAYDNDKAGQDGIKKDKVTLRGLGAYVDSIKLPEGYKDCTDFIFDSNTGSINKPNVSLLKRQVTTKIHGLLNC